MYFHETPGKKYLYYFAISLYVFSTKANKEELMNRSYVEKVGLCVSITCSLIMILKIIIS
jgi:hypothetical protein